MPPICSPFDPLPLPAEEVEFSTGIKTAREEEGRVMITVPTREPSTGLFARTTPHDFSSESARLYSARTSGPECVDTCSRTEAAFSRPWIRSNAKLTRWMLDSNPSGGAQWERLRIVRV
jgi:hypothetical protein